MESQAGQLSLVIHGPDHPNSVVLHRAQLRDITGFSEMVAHHDQLPLAAGSLKRLKNLQYMVFRLEPADDKEVPPGTRFH
jgi:hypothetical protein